MTALTNYRRFLSDGAAMRAMLWSIVGRLPLYLTSLAIVLLSIGSGNTIVDTGLVLACYSLGSAIAGPLIARWMDRVGQFVPLTTTGLVHVASIWALVLLAPDRWVGVVVVTLAGATIPPAGAGVRALWGTLPLGEEGRRGAYALEAVLGEVFVIVGPIGLSLALFVGTPGGALLVGSALTAIGAIGLACTSASRGWEPVRGERLDLLGPLSSRAFLLLLAVLFLPAVAGGTYALLLPAFATAQGSGQSAGLLFGVWGIGSALGGLWFGSRKSSSRPVELRFLLGLLFVAVGMVLPLFATDVIGMIVALVIGGVAIAPVSIVEYEFIQKLAPRTHISEAFTWVQTANMAGAVVGAQLAGIATEQLGATNSFGVAAVLGFLAAGLALAAAPTWRSAFSARMEPHEANEEWEPTMTLTEPNEAIALRNLHIVTMTSEEGDAVLEIARRCQAELGSPNSPGFAEHIWRWTQELPLRCRVEIGRFKAQVDCDAMIIRGIPVDDDSLGATPASWSSADTESSAPYGIAATLFGTLIGECIAWSTQQSGRIVTDIVPTRGMEDSLVSSSSTSELGWHTEDAFSEHRADFVGLLALRDPESAATTVAGVDLVSIPDSIRIVLSEERFLIVPDDAHDSRARETIRPVALLQGHPDAPVLRVDRDFTEVLDDTDDEARAALEWLIAHLDTRISDIPMRPGEMVFVNNRAVVHGRRPFQPRFDGTDRWLKRVSVVADLAKTNAGRHDLTSRQIG